MWQMDGEKERVGTRGDLHDTLWKE